MINCATHNTEIANNPNDVRQKGGVRQYVAEAFAPVSGGLWFGSREMIFSAKVNARSTAAIVVDMSSVSSRNHTLKQ